MVVVSHLCTWYCSLSNFWRNEFLRELELGFAWCTDLHISLLSRFNCSPRSKIRLDLDWERVNILFRGISLRLSKAHSFISCLTVFYQYPVKAKWIILVWSLLSVVWVRLIHFWHSKNPIYWLRGTYSKGTCICCRRNIRTQQPLCCSVLVFWIKVDDRHIWLYLRSIL